MRILRKRAGLEGAGAPGVDRTEDDAKPDRVIACAACLAPITVASARVEKAGRHHHTCVNPAGCVFHIACFASAPGAVAHGDPSDHFSWFDGYRWQMASCRGCTAHLGWSFSGAVANDVFWGLIRAQLVERS